MGETTLGKKLRRERTSAEGRKAKEIFQSHDSARSERSWEIEIQMGKVIERSADRGTWAEGGDMRLSPERARGEDRIRDSQRSSRSHVVGLRGRGRGYHRDGLAV